MVSQKTAPESAEPNQPKEATTSPQLDMGEAPYSWSRKAVDKDGFEDIFTVRSITSRGFLKRVDSMKAALVERGYRPAPARGSTAAGAPVTESGEVAPVCPYHKIPMQKRQGKNGPFWSCHNKIEGTDEWCSYKPPKP